MDASAEEAIETLVARYPRWETPSGALNQCRIAGDLLLAELHDRGVKGEVLWVADTRRPNSSDLPGLAPHHLLVLIEGGNAIDLTRRQWEPDAKHPTVYRSLAEVGRDWGSYWAPGDDRNGACLRFD